MVDEEINSYKDPQRIKIRAYVHFTQDKLNISSVLDGEDINVKILKTIYVEDMAEVEGELHQKFSRCNVDLIKSQEWFDFNPAQFLIVNWEFEKRSLHVFSLSDLPSYVNHFQHDRTFGSGNRSGKIDKSAR